ncbi:MAG: FkbM family methyltransferase [Rhodospirillum sp.]|nr:FkbM family methyltransferase [Rhodospirillum sp.]MCF8491407.1 FkbM family methyltransferase [Rhodospirillum sp.]MCF8501296.1 FkbM family methyltransferase [Rhodospirillum sp.]
MNHSARLDTALGLARSLIVYYGQPWRRLSLKRFHRPLLTPGDLVFDIGAHVGSRAKTYLSLGLEVVAVEPQPAFADLLGRHFSRRLKGLERVAVGAESGEVILHVSSRHPTVTSTSGAFIESARHAEGFRDVVWDRTILVPMTTLDALIARHGKPAFCKIDVEGAESQVLRGLSQPLTLVAFEYIPAMRADTLAAIDILMALGDYRFNRVVGERHRFVSPEWTTRDALLKDLEALPPNASSGDIYARLTR